MAENRRHSRRHVDPVVRDSVVRSLVQARERGEFRAEQVAVVAEQLAVCERTVWGWLQLARSEGRSLRKERPRLEVTEADVVDLAYHRGSVAAFHRERSQAGPTPGIDAWRRAFGRALSPGRRAGLIRGERARRDYDTYLMRQPDFRNEEWQADHTQLAVSVLLPDRRVVRPWATLFLDRFSRAIPGFAISVTPSRESILAALRSAIMIEPPYGPIGGVPLAIRIDRGRDFLARAIRTVTAALLIDLRPATAYAPHQKGAIERVNESVEQLLLRELPGFLHGARDRAGRLLDADASLLPLQSFVELFAQFVHWYHVDRPHEGLGGRTPMEVWNGDPTPLRTVAPERLRHMMLVGVNRTVNKAGVRLDGRWYNCAQLCGYVGEQVEVRHMPHHDEAVEVFLGERHLGTAVLVNRMSRGDAQELLERRAEEARWLRSVTRAAARKRRFVYAAMTEPGPPLPVSPLVESSGAERAAYSDDDERQLASRSLVSHGAIPERLTRPLSRGRR